LKLVANYQEEENDCDYGKKYRSGPPARTRHLSERKFGTRWIRLLHESTARLAFGFALVVGVVMAKRQPSVYSAFIFGGYYAYTFGLVKGRNLRRESSLIVFATSASARRRPMDSSLSNPKTSKDSRRLIDFPDLLGTEFLLRWKGEKMCVLPHRSN
jgi:hypothetical protein